MKLYNTLTFKFAALFLLVALILSIAPGIYILGIERSRYRESVAEEIDRVLLAMEIPAAQAAYTIDYALAQKITDALTGVTYFSGALIVDDFGEVLSQTGTLPEGIPIIGGDFPVFTDSIHSDRLYQDAELAVGELRVAIAGSEIESAFWKDSKGFVIGYILWMLFLVFILTSIFYVWMLYPLLRLSRSLSVNTEPPYTEIAIPRPRWHEKDEFGTLSRNIENLLTGFQKSLNRQIKGELELKNSLTEKETLLKEVHHRVKNNLQIVSSLLHLQSPGIKDTHDRQRFTECQNRIMAMALVHEELYRSESLAQISSRDYIEKLTHSLKAIYVDNGNVDVSMEVEDFLLDINKAIIFGLILNELISNALKYGVVEGKRSMVRINAVKRNDTVYASVVDNGPGLPEGLKVEESDTLGLQLTESLITQLGGELEYHSEGGAHFHFTFSPND